MKSKKMRELDIIVDCLIEQGIEIKMELFGRQSSTKLAESPKMLQDDCIAKMKLLGVDFESANAIVEYSVFWGLAIFDEKSTSWDDVERVHSVAYELAGFDK